MYYLNDKHPEFEYAIYTRVNNGCPYISHIFSDLNQVYQFFRLVEERHSKYNHIFYIDAEGYKNEYTKELAMFYYKLLKRPVNDWQSVA